jgi:hypothetical protein
MSSAGYEPVATTEEPSPSRPRKYRVIVVFVSLLVGLASFYQFGIWILPSARVESRPSPSSTLTTPSQKELNNTETQVVMHHGKYSVG